MVAKAQQKSSKTLLRKTVKPKSIRKLEKTRPRKFMNPFLCFAHEERAKAKNGHLLSDWKAAHKGLGAKWRALGAGKAKFGKQGKIPSFAAFVKEYPQHKEILPVWRNAHKGLGGKWKALDRNGKAKYVETSKKMRGAYENQMKGYRIKKQELLREIKAAKKTKRSAKRPTKIRVASKNKSKRMKVAPKQKSKAVAKPISVEKMPSKKSQSEMMKVAPKQKSKAVAKPKSVEKMPSKKSQSEMMKVARKINARIRMTCISSRIMQ